MPEPATESIKEPSQGYKLRVVSVAVMLRRRADGAVFAPVRTTHRLCPLVLDRQVVTCLLCGAVGDVFKALADPARRAILDELAERDGQTLFEICGRLANKHGLSMSRQGISQHLDVLEDAGLVSTRREGRYKFHDMHTDALESLIERWLERPGKANR